MSMETVIMDTTTESTPIFWSIVKEYRESGRELPSLPYRTFKPSGTIALLESSSRGIQWAPAPYPLRESLDETPVYSVPCLEDNCPVCDFFN